MSGEDDIRRQVEQALPPVRAVAIEAYTMFQEFIAAGFGDARAFTLTVEFLKLGWAHNMRRQP